MAMNKRERTIAIVLGATLAAYVGYFYGIDPYFTADAQIRKDQLAVDNQSKIAHHLLENHKKVNDEWKGMIANGLESNAPNAEHRALNAITDWAANRNVHVDSHKVDTPTQAGDFQQMRVTVTGSGNLSSIYRLLGDVETSHLPVQISDCRITSKKADGTDELSIQLTVNTLIFSPAQTTTKPSTGKTAAPAGGDPI
jgi:hypothetical protein